MENRDSRNWPIYNEKLVKRGWFYLSTDFVKNWDNELKKTVIEIIAKAGYEVKKLKDRGIAPHS